MSTRRLSLKITLPCLFILLLGCNNLKPAPREVTLKESYADLKRFCEEQYQLPVRLFPAGSTLWIYLPMESQILEMKASNTQSSQSKDYALRPMIKYIKADSIDGKINVEYDIGLDKTYPKSPGYEYAYSQAYQDNSRYIYNAMAETLFSLIESPADEPPEFIVIVIADIKNGIQSQNIIYFKDFYHAMSIVQAVSQEEFVKRSVYEISGDKAIINDKEGTYLNIEDIKMPVFLSRQIVHRLNFKYQQSSNPPSKKTEEEVNAVIEETLKAYQIKDPHLIHAVNLETSRN